MKKTYIKPEIEVINYGKNDFMTYSGEPCNSGHGNNGNHYGWGDPQPGHGNDNGHGHNHGGNGHP